MTHLGGHCLPTILEAFSQIDESVPTAIIAYTVKGHGLPIAGHRDNHGGLLNEQQIKDVQAKMGVNDGEEWERCVVVLCDTM